MSAMIIGTRGWGLASLFMVIYCHNDNILSISMWRIWADGSDRRLSGVFLFALDGPAVGRVGQAEIFAQRLAFVIFAEQTAPLQFRDQQIDNVLEPAREGQR